MFAWSSRAKAWDVTAIFPEGRKDGYGRDLPSRSMTLRVETTLAFDAGTAWNVLQAIKLCMETQLPLELGS